MWWFQVTGFCVLYPAHNNVPTISEADQTLVAVVELLKALQQTIPSSSKESAPHAGHTMTDCHPGKCARTKGNQNVTTEEDPRSTSKGELSYRAGTDKNPGDIPIHQLHSQYLFWPHAKSTVHASPQIQQWCNHLRGRKASTTATSSGCNQSPSTSQVVCPTIMVI